MKLFVEVYGLRLSVFTHWDTLALWWCANTETEKKRNRVPEIENRIEPNLRNRNRPSPTLGHVRFTKTGFRSVSYSSETGICKTNWLREIGLTCFIVVSFAKTEMLRRKNGNGNANCEH